MGLSKIFKKKNDVIDNYSTSEHDEVLKWLNSRKNVETVEIQSTKTPVYSQYNKKRVLYYEDTHTCYRCGYNTKSPEKYFHYGTIFSVEQYSFDDINSSIVTCEKCGLKSMYMMLGRINPKIEIWDTEE